MASSPTRIFYVDDDPDDRDLFEHAVHTLDRGVLLFSLGEEMLASIQNPPPAPSIIFMDLNMPTMTGEELLTAIRSNAIFDQVPIVILSTARDPKTIDRCWQNGADLYVTKFVDLKMFARAIKTIVEFDWKNRTRARNEFLFTMA